MSAGTRLLIAGASSRTICGVRDQSRILEATLDERGADAMTLWWEREEFAPPGQALRSCRAWLRSVLETINSTRPTWVIWAYSPFPFSHRGIPFFTPMVARALGRARVPVAAFLHELAYPFGRYGWRGDVWAVTQRAALRSLTGNSAALIVTTEERLEWLRTRRWLSQRPALFTPVFSNVPSVSETDGRGESVLRVGVFGFGSENFRLHPVVSSLATLRDEGIQARLVLIGAPGAPSGPATDWLQAADASGCREAMSFTGVLSPEAIARALRAVDIVVFPDELGPSPRKTSLAASLSLGKPVVAFDGPSRWDAAIAENALVLVDAEGSRLAGELRRLWLDTQARHHQGARARTFYARRMAREVVADSVLEFLDGLSPVTRRLMSQGARE